MRSVSAGVIVLALVVLPLSAAIKQPVKVQGGLVSGVPGKDASVTVFKGIPYAAPPVGEFRWKAPAPAMEWKGIRKADSFGPSCMQTIVKERKPWTYEFMAHGNISEDCLSLNVWTAAKSSSETRPVYVYFYGGGFNEGSGAVPVYDGEGLATKGIVVVTINYRVGVLGFFAHPELTKEAPYNASGNYGLLDQIAAETFVKQSRQRYGDMGDEFLKLYPAVTDAEAEASHVKSSRDQAMVSMYLWAQQRAKTAKTKAFIYLWDHTLPGPDAAQYGAFHTSEVPYVMNTLYMSDRPFVDADRQIAEMMSSYWANFISAGDPNGKGLAAWPEVGDKKVVMELGDVTQPVPLTGSDAQYDFFKRFLIR